MVLVSRARLLAIAVGASVLLTSAGLAWDFARFGWQAGDHEARLQRELTSRVAERIAALSATGARVAGSGDLVAAASASRDALPALFARLSEPAAASVEAVSATVWIPAGPGGGDYRALAWTDGPSEDIAAPRLNQAPDLFVANGASGLRLVFVQPIDDRGARVGVASAETQLSIPAPAGTFGQQYSISTSAGPLPIEAVVDQAATAADHRVIVSSPAGVSLFSVGVPGDQLAGARRTFRWRLAGVAVLPFAGLFYALLMTVTLRRRVSHTLAAWIAWTAAMGLAIVAGAIAATWLLHQAQMPPVWSDVLAGITVLALAAMGAGDAWRRTAPLRAGRRDPARFVLEHAAGGVAVAAGFLVAAWLWRDRIDAASLEQWHLPVLPSSVPATAELAALLAAQIALAWVTATVLGVLAARWRISWRTPRAWAAAVLWAAPCAVVPWLMPNGRAELFADALTIAGSTVLFGLAANAIRRRYRRGSEARRLVLQFCALLAPVLAAYPLAVSSADRAMRDVIERDYAPAAQAAQQPDRVMNVLTAAWADIDAFTDLPDLLREAGTSVNSTQLAFRVWNRTVLSRERVSSQIELYGPTRVLVSRFALNVPEFGSLLQSGERTWPGAGCAWDSFAEVARFGAGERRMLHAERALCGAGGEFLGAVVVRIMPDYRTLPFVTSANPYYDALGAGDRPGTGSRVSELQVVVYGWSLQPLFVSGRTVWPLDRDLADRVYRSREPFWADRAIEGRTYHLRVLSDRGGIYVLGYPAPAPLQHATRLAESAALLLLLFLGYLATTIVRPPVEGRPIGSLNRVFAEIRASFYRKLFLFFVVAAIAPVVLFAIAFGAYMTERLRADVESEASSLVITARRVFDELARPRRHPARAGRSRMTT